MKKNNDNAKEAMRTIMQEEWPKTFEEFFERFVKKMKEKIPDDPNDTDTEEDN